jgi:N-acetylglucosaminyldiphosphoundecaprenol N-acetyl-beta-D-mannosaminyltransferase
MVLSALERVWILGVPVDRLTLGELQARVADTIAAGRKSLVLHVNAHCMNLAYTHEWLKNLLNSADVVFCDGGGVRLAARLLGHALPERLTSADWIWPFSEFVRDRGYTVYLLGGKSGVADRAGRHLQKRFPGLRIAGTHHGYFDKEPGSAENEAVIGQINAAKPNLLFVGFGMPLQEQWLMENLPRLDANACFSIGALFDYVSGDLRRSPQWLNDHGMEWLGRMLIEPRRLWRRYLIGNPLFMWRVLRQRLGVLPASKSPPGAR